MSHFDDDEQFEPLEKYFPNSKPLWSEKVAEEVIEEDEEGLNLSRKEIVERLENLTAKFFEGLVSHLGVKVGS